MWSRKSSPWRRRKILFCRASKCKCVSWNNSKSFSSWSTQERHRKRQSVHAKFEELLRDSWKHVRNPRLISQRMIFRGIGPNRNFSSQYRIDDVIACTIASIRSRSIRSWCRKNQIRKDASSALGFRRSQWIARFIRQRCTTFCQSTKDTSVLDFQLVDVEAYSSELDLVLAQFASADLNSSWVLTTADDSTHEN